MDSIILTSTDPPSRSTRRGGRACRQSGSIVAYTCPERVLYASFALYGQKDRKDGLKGPRRRPNRPIKQGPLLLCDVCAIGSSRAGSFRPAWQSRRFNLKQASG
jgi:hypothetical protein